MDSEEFLSRLNDVEISNIRKKLAYLESFKEGIESKTTLELLTKSTAYSKWAFQEYRKLIKATIIFLGTIASESKEAHALTEDAVNDFKQGLIDINEANQFLELAKNHRELTRLEIGLVMDLVISLGEVLSSKIFTEKNNEFDGTSVKEIVLSLIKKIDVFSLLDDYEVIRKANANYRIGITLDGADEIFTYLERFNDSIVFWIASVRGFRKRVLLEIENE